MQDLFNISERFSKTLNDVRGPDRQRQYFSQAKAWLRPSSSRRTVAKIFSYGGLGLLVGVFGLSLFKIASTQVSSKVYRQSRGKPREIREVGREELAA